MTIAGFAFKIHTIPFIAVSLILTMGCDSSHDTNSGDSGVSNLTPLAGTVLTSYLSFSYDRDDTVSLSFNFDGDDISAIEVKGTLDSGVTWIPITDISEDAANLATISWAPLNSLTADFEFFGLKQAYIRITDLNSGQFMDSETFSIIGKSPINLTSPLGGESFSIADSVHIFYSANVDLTSQIMVFFKTPSMADWEELIETQALESSGLPIKNFVTAFVPLDYADQAGNFSEPIKILLADYGVQTVQNVSGDITISP